MLRSLLSAQGVSPQMITVFIDGYYEVSGAWGLWEEQSAGLQVSDLIDHARRDSCRVFHRGDDKILPKGGSRRLDNFLNW